MLAAIVSNAQLATSAAVVNRVASKVMARRSITADFKAVNHAVLAVVSLAVVDSAALRCISEAAAHRVQVVVAGEIQLGYGA